MAISSEGVLDSIKPEPPPRLQRHGIGETLPYSVLRLILQHPDKWLSHALYSYRHTGGTTFFLVPWEIAGCGDDQVVVQCIGSLSAGGSCVPIDLTETSVLAQIRALYPENIEIKD